MIFKINISIFEIFKNDSNGYKFLLLKFFKFYPVVFISKLKSYETYINISKFKSYCIEVSMQ